MKTTETKYDCIIVGGGLAGLSLSILLVQKSFSVLLVEKKSYPYHKVCGEYISMESWNFIKLLGIPLSEMNLPKIDTLNLTDIKGRKVEQKMTSGGFGISRFKLDNLLFEKAKKMGVTVLENCTCTHFERTKDSFGIITNKGIFSGKLLCASFGRHGFGNFAKQKTEVENWLGVKYHIEIDYPKNIIGLHTFPNGYCGISKIDEDKFCLCYLVKSSSLKKHQGNIQLMEKNELFQNPFLKEIFTTAKMIYDKPLTISNIGFKEKQAVQNGVFYIGDAAGAIAPLTGNGMSNAMRSAHILAPLLEKYLNKEIPFIESEQEYIKNWNKSFRGRILTGKLIQTLFCNPRLTNFFLFFVSKSEWIRKQIIAQTHGNSF